MLRFPRIGMLLSGIIVLSNIVGCATFYAPFATSFHKKFPKATAADPVAQIVCFWSPGEGNDPDGVPCKGFMGNILFLSQSASRPLEIDGEVRVYLFDDQGTPEEQSKPLRMFNFDSGSWNVHLTDSSFGAAYQIFVPYVRRGTPKANCSMRVRLKPTVGPVVFSEFTNMPLNGYTKTLRGDEAKAINQDEVDKLAAEAMSQELRRTTTISMDKTVKVSETSAVEKRDSNSGHIQLAAYETENNPNPSSAASASPSQPNSDAERIRHLEAMLQQLLDQKAQNPVNAPQTTPAPQLVPVPRTAPVPRINPLQRMEADVEDESERIHMNQKRISPGEEKKQGAETKRREEANAIQQWVPRRLSHPLDDDLPAESSADTEPEELDESGEERFEEPIESAVNKPQRFNLSGNR